jgi:CRISPR/Cas system-associated protein endoribonuclease Cas2
MLSITDLQYSKMETLVGVKKEEEKLEKTQLLLF